MGNKAELKETNLILPELDAIKARAEAATGDNWSIEYGNCGCSADAEFIAAARTDVPRLVAALEAVLAVENVITDCDCDNCVGYNVALIEVREAVERALKEGQ